MESQAYSSVNGFFGAVSILLGFLGLYIFCLRKIFKDYTREKERAEELKKERMEKINIIAQKMLAVFKYDNQLQESFERISLLRSLHNDFPDSLYWIFFMSGSKLFFEANKKKFQNFFDQLLKIYAEKLKTAYDNEENFKKERGEVEFDSISGDEIRDFLKRKRFFSEEKKRAEEENWGLHDALRDIGFDVWAEKSDGIGYKAYLYLKKSYSF